MPQLRLTSTIAAPAGTCFDLSLDVEVHTRSTGAREEIIDGVRSGRMRLGDEVTWKAWHFGIPWRMSSKVVEHERPTRFVDEQTRGPFSRWRHEHRFEDRDDVTTMTDVVDYRSPLGPVGVVVDRLLLQRYLTHLLEVRNAVLTQEAEAAAGSR